jgi:ELWxxDGT repeat protein
VSIRRVTLALASVACLLVLISVPASARREPAAHPPHPVPSHPVYPHGNRPHTVPAGGLAANSSDPNDLISHGGFIWFDAYSPSTGNALWKSDTFTTTAIYKDIEPFELRWAGNRLFFVANDGTHGNELWVSNGTHAGTHQVKDSVTGPDSAQIYDMIVVGNRVFYEENDGIHGYEPWVSDGTPGGTHIAKDIVPGPDDSDPYQFGALGNKAVFTASTPSHGRELWVSDGTPTGTKLLRDIYPGPDGSYPYEFTRIGSRLAFTAEDDTHGYEVWVTDTTKAGTKLLKDIAPGTVGSYPDADNMLFTVVDGLLYFAANDGVHNSELWKTDGTTAGTKLAADIRPGSRAGNPQYLNATTNAMYINATDGTHGYELWKFDGTKGGTSLLKDIRPGIQSSFPYLDSYDSAAIGKKLLFGADDGTHGYEVWVTDGSATGTRLVKDIQPGSDSSEPYQFQTVKTGTIRGTVVFFVADNDARGRELWFSDGTNSGTHVIDIYP